MTWKYPGDQVNINLDLKIHSGMKLTLSRGYYIQNSGGIYIILFQKTLTSILITKF